jgi:hypothetical protein
VRTIAAWILLTLSNTLWGAAVWMLPDSHPYKVFSKSLRPQVTAARHVALGGSRPRKRSPISTQVPGPRKRRFHRQTTHDLWSSVPGTGALAGPSIASVLAVLEATNQLPISF